jgi:hypothetical protein
VIASVTQAFCRTCTRARLSAEGKLYTCLFGIRGHDLRTLHIPADSPEPISHLFRLCHFREGMLRGRGCRLVANGALPRLVSGIRASASAPAGCRRILAMRTVPESKHLSIDRK